MIAILRGFFYSAYVGSIWLAYFIYLFGANVKRLLNEQHLVLL